tara:strand:- start:31 stop:300 length:270 start_codon:yes stop_codon:yes gene_type:complete
VVLHSLELKHSKSTFPLTLGAHITAVDDRTYSSTGEAFSTVLLPNSESSNVRQLQADDVTLACVAAPQVQPMPQRPLIAVAHSSAGTSS